MVSRTPVPSPDEESLAEQTLDSRVAFEGVFLELMVDHVRAADGHEATREYLRHPGAVMVIPLLDNDEVVLERQFRYPLRRTFIGKRLDKDLTEVGKRRGDPPKRPSAARQLSVLLSRLVAPVPSS